MTEPRDGGFGIYVHWPFCQAKCPYCDFNSHVTAQIDQTRWIVAFEQELDRYQSLIGDRLVGSVYFGGGTPSLMEGTTVAAILDRIRTNWSVANDWEVTLEANPTSVEASRFETYRAAGVNRVSLGVQALRDEDLRRLGRMHSASEAVAAFEVARTCFDRVSFDLIYARQDQSLEAWLQELDEALDHAADHLSLYQLTVEPGTAFWTRHKAGGLRGLPDEDLAADMYDATLERCAASGLEAYEVSNLARPGYESVHNMMYWSRGEYIGVGPGAHGRANLKGERWATEQVMQPGAWLQAVPEGAADTWTALSQEDQVSEYLMMGLRTMQGVRVDWLRDMKAPDQLFETLGRLSTEGYIAMDDTRLRCTPSGRIVLNAVLRELLA